MARTAAVWIAVALGALSAAEATAEAADLGRLTFGANFDYSSGDYEDGDDTEILYGSILLAYLTPEIAATGAVDDWVEVRGVVPWVQLDGPATAPRGGVRAPTDEREDGLGDVLLRASYWGRPAAWRFLPYLEVSAEVKFPTADETRGLGTGEADVTVEGGLSHRVGPVALFANGGRRFMGDPNGVNLRDRWLASGGASLDLGADFSLGGLYVFRQSAFRANEDAHELVPFAWWSVSDALRLGPYGSFGLSRGSPDYAVGLQLRFDIDVRAPLAPDLRD